TARSSPCSWKPAPTSAPSGRTATSAEHRCTPPPTATSAPSPNCSSSTAPTCGQPAATAGASWPRRDFTTRKRSPTCCVNTGSRSRRFPTSSSSSSAFSGRTTEDEDEDDDVGKQLASRQRNVLQLEGVDVSRAGAEEDLGAEAGRGAAAELVAEGEL